MADALTDRQLKGRMWPSEGVDVTVIAVQACNPSSEQAQDVDRVLVKRLKVEDVILQNVLKYKPAVEWLRKADLKWAYKAYLDRAILIQDPESTMFGLPSRIDADVQQVLSAQPRLPSEVRNVILDHL